MKTKIFAIATIIFFACYFNAMAKKGMGSIPLIGSDAPSFSAETTHGKFNFPGDFGSDWKILFSHPMDFTPVCTSEIMELARIQDTFRELDVSIAVISTDTKNQHEAWKLYMEELLAAEAEPMKIGFPLIDDHKAGISRLYGMMHGESKNTKDVRGVFIIDPENIIKAIYFYPSSTGRNMDEIVRTVKALQVTHTSHLYTPVNWVPGDDLVVPHFPYLPEEVAENPALAENFYVVGHIMWYKKGENHLTRK